MTRQPNRFVSLVLALASSVALAQAPRLAPYPIDVLVRGLGPKQLTEFQATYRQALVAAGTSPVDLFAVQSALRQLKRQDCDVDDQCLRQFAVLTNALYATFVVVKADSRGVTFTATGRVLRDDGKVVISAKTVSVERKDKQSVESAAEAAVVAVLKAMEISKLPASRETALPPPVEPPQPVDAGVAQPAALAPVDAGVVWLPPPPPPVEQSPLGTIGLVAAATGAAAAVTGGILFGIGAGAMRPVNELGQIVPGPGQSAEDALRGYRQAQALQPVGVGLLVGGAAVGVAGAVLAFLAPSSPKVAVVPMAGGAFVGVSGELP